jgi:glycosyltransferase involved in cell wall biosynthesis
VKRGQQVRSVLLAHPSADLYGSDRVMLETVIGLVDRGWRVFVTLPSGGPLVPELEMRGATVRICRTPVLRKSALRPAGFIGLVLDTLRSIPGSIRLIRSSRASVVFVNTVTIPLWLVLARCLQTPTVCHVHEAEGSAPILQQRLLAFPLLFANRIVANSKFSRDVLSRSYPRLAARTSVIYNGVIGPAHPSSGRAQLAGPTRLLFVGRLSPRKGPAVAINALRALTRRGVDARLDLVGDVFPGYEWFADELQQDVVSENLQELVTFHGFQSDIWSHVAAADVMLVPSLLDEPFGNTAVEAVLAARPVIVSATSGLREATDGVASARMVVPGDPEALAVAVEELMENWPEFCRLVDDDALVARERYAPERYQREIADLVEDLTGPKR